MVTQEAAEGPDRTEVGADEPGDLDRRRRPWARRHDRGCQALDPLRLRHVVRRRRDAVARTPASCEDAGDRGGERGRLRDVERGPQHVGARSEAVEEDDLRRVDAARRELRRDLERQHAAVRVAAEDDRAGGSGARQHRIRHLRRDLGDRPFIAADVPGLEEVGRRVGAEQLREPPAPILLRR